MWQNMLKRRARQRVHPPGDRGGGPAVEPGEAFEFAFEGRPVRARHGQSVAAALLANGIRTLRFDEAGNPKGLLCGIGYCFECRCVIDDQPDRRACMVEASPGMRVCRQEGLT
jgi:hypothetical protein